jgi:hypothetical protein
MNNELECGLERPRRIIENLTDDSPSPGRGPNINVKHYRQEACPADSVKTIPVPHLHAKLHEIQPN